MQELDVKYPNVVVQLTGTDGNAFSVLGKVSAALRRAGVTAEERAAFMKQATAGDYNALLQVVQEWCTVE